MYLILLCINFIIMDFLILKIKECQKKKIFFFVVISPMFIKYVHPPKTCMKLWHAIWNWKYQYLAKNKPEVLVVVFVVKAPSLFLLPPSLKQEKMKYIWQICTETYPTYLVLTYLAHNPCIRSCCNFHQNWRRTY